MEGYAISKTNQNSYSEVYGILLSLGNEFISKVPQNILNNIAANVPYTIENNRKKYNIPKYDLRVSLKVQGASKESISMICYLYKNYWCSNDKEKVYIERVVKNNNIKLEEEKKKKYDVNNIFEKDVNKEINENVISQDSLIEVKEKNIFEKIIEKIMMILKK